MSGLVFIISAPSGSGKSTLVNELRKFVREIDFSVSYTTRPPRGSEQEGREYHYISRPQFERMIAAGEFLEHAEVFGNYYGTARRFLDEAIARGHDLLLDIDVQGAEQLRKKLPDAISIFVLPPSRRELELRLRRRSSAENVQDEVIRRRLDTASREISNYRLYNYILVNDRLEDSIERLKAIVLRERLRHAPQAPANEDRELMRLAESCRLEQSRECIQSILDTFQQSGASAVPK